MIVFIDSIDGTYAGVPGVRWQMTFDLEWICENAGKRVTVYSYVYHKNLSYVAFPMNKVKKALRLCYLYSDNEKREVIKDFLANYPKMLKIWEKLP